MCRACIQTVRIAQRFSSGSGCMHAGPFLPSGLRPACLPARRKGILDRPLPHQLGLLQLTFPPGYMFIWAGPLRLKIRNSFVGRARFFPPKAFASGPQASKRYFIHVNYIPMSTQDISMPSLLLQKKKKNQLRIYI